MAKDPYRYFRLEARELLDQLGKGVLELEKGRGTAEIVQRLLRLAHTLKGAARVVKQGEVADRAHAIEDALAPFRESAGAVPADRIDGMLTLVDEIGNLVALLAPPVPAGKPSPDDSLQTIRAGVAEMDALLEGITESHVQLRTLRTVARSVDRARDLTDRLVSQLAVRSTREGVGQGAMILPVAYSTAEELQQIFGVLERQFSPGLDQLDRELRQVRESAEQLRLTPARTIFTSLERTVRDTAQALNKRATFETAGGDVRIEAHVLGPVQRALLQAVRNAVAHGIEPEADRKAAGKPLTGRVTLDVARQGRFVAFRCRDDGRGVDLEAVRRVAVRRGLSASGTKNLGAQDLMRLLLRGGISTSDAVTEVSGRGVGLDVMREVAEQLGGEVAVLTEAGQGTTVDLVIPALDGVARVAPRRERRCGGGDPFRFRSADASSRRSRHLPDGRTRIDRVRRECHPVCRVDASASPAFGRRTTRLDLVGRHRGRSRRRRGHRRRSLARDGTHRPAPAAGSHAGGCRRRRRVARCRRQSAARPRSRRSRRRGDERGCR